MAVDLWSTPNNILPPPPPPPPPPVLSMQSESGPKTYLPNPLVWYIAGLGRLNLSACSDYAHISEFIVPVPSLYARPGRRRGEGGEAVQGWNGPRSCLAAIPPPRPPPFAVIRTETRTSNDQRRRMMYVALIFQRPHRLKDRASLLSDGLAIETCRNKVVRVIMIGNRRWYKWLVEASASEVTDAFNFVRPRDELLILQMTQWLNDSMTHRSQDLGQCNEQCFSCKRSDADKIIVSLEV